MRFTLGEILSVTTGILLCPVDRVYVILDFLTGESLLTHQLPRASSCAAPYLLELFPQLKDIDASEVNSSNYSTFLEKQIAIHGDAFEVVNRLPDGRYPVKNPIQEFADMKAGKNE